MNTKTDAPLFERVDDDSGEYQRTNHRTENASTDWSAWPAEDRGALDESDRDELAPTPATAASDPGAGPWSDAGTAEVRDAAASPVVAVDVDHLPWRKAELRVESVLPPFDGRLETVGMLPPGLEESIEANGLLEPITVAEEGPGQYRLISGERRLAAMRNRSQGTIPARVLYKPDGSPLTEVEVRQLTIASNRGRKDLDRVTRTTQILHLVAADLDLDVDATKRLLQRMNRNKSLVRTDPLAQKAEELFSRIGVVRSTFVGTHLPILDFDEELKLAVGQGRIGYTKAKLINSIDDPNDPEAKGWMRRILSNAVTASYSRPALERVVDAYLAGKKRPSRRSMDPFHGPLSELNNAKRLLSRHRKDYPPEFVDQVSKTISILADQVWEVAKEFERVKQEEEEARKAASQGEDVWTDESPKDSDYPDGDLPF